MEITEDRKDGYEACKAWMLRGASEAERSLLAAMFEGGFFIVNVAPHNFRSLPTVLESHHPQGSFLVDFSSSPWLSGFRQAVIEEISEPD